MKRIAPFLWTALMLAPAHAAAQSEGGEEWSEGAAKVAEGEIIPGAEGASGDAIYSDLLKVRDQEPPKGTPVVAARLFPVDKKLELAAGFEMSVIDKFVGHTGGSVAVAYHLDELWAVQLHGGFFQGKPRRLLQAAEDKASGFECNVHNDAGNNPLEAYKNCLPDTNSMSWFVGVDLVSEPFYGKLNLVSELAVNFDIALSVGAGVFGRRGFSRVDTGGFTTVDFDTERDAVAPYLTASAGFRVWLMKDLAVRLVARDYTYVGDRPYLELNQPTAEAERSDISHNWTMQFGIAYLL
jgi:outer membrane beta-barrel protein